MGGVLGSVVGAAGSIIGGKQSANASKKAAQIQAAAQDRAGERALTGYKYLTEGAGAAPMKGYIDAGQTALKNQGTTQNLMMDLLGITNYGNQRNPAAEAPAAAPAGAAPTNGLQGYMGLAGPGSGQGATGGAFYPSGANGIPATGLPPGITAAPAPQGNPNAFVFYNQQGQPWNNSPQGGVPAYMNYPNGN